MMTTRKSSRRHSPPSGPTLVRSGAHLCRCVGSRRDNHRRGNRPAIRLSRGPFICGQYSVLRQPLAKFRGDCKKCQGTALVVPKNYQKILGFTGCGRTRRGCFKWLLCNRTRLQSCRNCNKVKMRTLQVEKKLRSEGGGGFNPRIRPAESTRALAPEERFHRFCPNLGLFPQPV